MRTKDLLIARIHQRPLRGCVERDDCFNLVEEAHEKLGGLDWIVANAGWGRASPFNGISVHLSRMADAFTQADSGTACTFNVKRPH